MVKLGCLNLQKYFYIKYPIIYSLIIYCFLSVSQYAEGKRIICSQYVGYNFWK